MSSIHLSVATLLLCTITTLSSYSQTGPGGVGNSSNNVLWLSADNGVYTDAGSTLAVNGDNVQQWNDRSGNTSNASEGTVGNQPNYQTGILNGLPVIRFTAGNNDQILSTGITTGNAASIWIVAQYSSLPSDNPGLFHGAPAGSAFDPNGNNKSVGAWVDGAPDSGPAGTQVWGRGIQSNGTIQNISQATVLSASTTYSVSNIYDGSSNITQYVNSSAAGNVGYNGTLQDWSDFGIGRQGGESWNGDIAEVIVYNTAANTAQRIIIDNYIAAKWGFTLTSNDLYDEDNAGFDFDVAGIGRAANATQTNTDAQSSIVRINGPSGLGNNEYYIWGHDNGALVPVTTNIPASVEARLERIWRGSETGTITNFDLSFDMTGLGSVTASDLRLLIDTDNDGSFTDETPLSGASSLGSNIYQFANVTGLNNNIRFTLAMADSNNTPLPVELVSFSSTQRDNQVALNWKTASELNNDYFTIERSRDGRHYTTLLTVVGSGTSLAGNSYEVFDENPFLGRSYYRLSQTDFDGTQEAVGITTLVVKPSPPSFTVYPNPGSGSIHIDITHGDADHGSISIYDLTGRELLRKSFENSEQRSTSQLVIEDASKLQPGIYLLRVIEGDFLQETRLVIK